MIELKGLTKHYGRFIAVDGITLTIPRGELYGLLGPNGAGKTTAIRLLAALIPPTHGDATIAGYSVT